MQNDLVGVERVVVCTGHSVDGLLERRVVERLHLAAVPANEVMVVLTAGVGRLEAGYAMPKFDAMNEPQLGKLVERAVDAGDPNRPPFRTQPVEELLRGEAAVLGGQILDHGVTGPARTSARATKLVARVISPYERIGRRHC